MPAYTAVAAERYFPYRDLAEIAAQELHRWKIAASVVPFRPHTGPRGLAWTLIADAPPVPQPDTPAVCDQTGCTGIPVGRYLVAVPVLHDGGILGRAATLRLCRPCLTTRVNDVREQHGYVISV